MTTTDYIAKVRGMIERATPGPWNADLGNWQVESRNSKTSRHGICSFTHENRDCINGEPNPVDPQNDAELIASSPAELARLCSALETAERALAFIDNDLGGGVSVSAGACHQVARKAQSKIQKILSEGGGA